MKQITFVSCLAILAAGVLDAQELPPFSFAFGGGYTSSLGSSGRYLDNGWNVQVGAGYNFNSYLGVMLDANYTGMGINSTTLANLGAQGGNVNVLSFTVDPIVHLHRKGPVDFYLVGGGGLYHRYDDLTAPTVGYIPVSTPFGLFNAPVMGALTSSSVNKPGFDGGAGISFGTKWHAKLYAEARYNRMLTSRPTDFIPVTFGIRW
jgi:opacity protein-like surface antigen